MPIGNSRYVPSPNFIHGSGVIDSDWTVQGDLYVNGTLIGGNVAGASSSTGQNLGAGQGIYAQNNNAVLQFRSLLATGTIGLTLLSGANTITISGAITPHSTYESGGSQEIVVSNLLGRLNDAQNVSVKINSGSIIGTRPILNFLSGTNVVLTASDDVANNQINIAISTSAGGGSINGGTNLGSGQGVFQGVNGANLLFRSLTSSGSVSVVSSSDTTTINISSSALLTATSTGSGINVLSGTAQTNLVFFSLTGSGNTIVSLSNNLITISSSGGTGSGGGGAGTITGATNDGAGAGVYETTNASNLVFRSLIASGSLSIGSGSNTISISGSFSNTQNVGSGQSVIQNVNAGIISFKTITGSGSIGISSGSDGQTLNVSSSAILSASSSGSGTPVFNALNGNQLSFNSITGVGNVTVTLNSNLLTISSSGAPSSPNTSIQFNNNGSFAGTSSLEVVSGSLLVQTTTMFVPTTITSSLTGTGWNNGYTPLFVYNKANKPVLSYAPQPFNNSTISVIGSPNVDLQSSFNKNIFLYTPGGGVSFGPTLNIINTVVTGVIAHPALSVSSLQASMRRTTFTTVGTQNALGGWLAPQDQVVRGNAPSIGGFFAFWRFGKGTNVSGSKVFIGLTNANASILNNSPLSSANSIGVYYDTNTPTGSQWMIMSVGTGSSNFTINVPNMNVADIVSVFDLYIYAPVSGNYVAFSIYNVSSGTVLTDNYQITGNALPDPTVFMRQHFNVSAGSGTTPTQLSLSKFYMESDF